MSMPQVMEQLVLGDTAVTVGIQYLECQQPAAVATTLCALGLQGRVFLPTQIAVTVQIVYRESRWARGILSARRCRQRRGQCQRDDGYEQRAHQRGAFRYSTRACMSASVRLKRWAGTRPERNRAGTASGGVLNLPGSAS